VPELLSPASGFRAIGEILSSPFELRASVSELLSPAFEFRAIREVLSSSIELHARGLELLSSFILKSKKRKQLIHCSRFSY
jgi:hypothetical protein